MKGYANAHLVLSARELASLRVDGEVSKFESRLLDRHLGRCDECGVFAAGVAEQSRVLRATPLVSFRATLTFPRRRDPRRVLQLAAVALAAVALVAGSVGLTTRGGHAGAPRVVPPRTPDDAVGESIARRAKLIAETPHFWRGPRGLQFS